MSASEVYSHPPPKTWPRYKKENCESCWASCCHAMPVEASVPDLIRLGVLSADEASTSLSKAARRLRKEGVIRSFRPRSLVFVLAQREGGDCIFLNAQRQCSVYARRPEICRQFPKIGPNPGHCPYREKTA